MSVTKLDLSEPTFQVVSVDKLTIDSMDTATERTGPIGTLILITDDEMRDILTHIAGAGDRVLFDRLRDRWTSLRYGTRSGPEVPARGRVVSARHTTLRIPL